MPLLCALRYTVNLTDTKFECGVSQRGVWGIYINGKLTKSWSIPVADTIEKGIFTIKATSENLELLRQTLSYGNLSQFGDCQSGQLIATTYLVDAIEKPMDTDISGPILQMWHPYQN